MIPKIDTIFELRVRPRLFHELRLDKHGLVGIRVTGTTHTLTKNKSGGTPGQNNASCQYAIGPSNTNGGQNTSSNNAAFSFTAAGGTSPSGCVPAPPIP